MRVREAREEGLLELETHLVASPIEWTQAVPSSTDGWVAMEWEVRAWLEANAGLDVGEATAIYQRARTWFCSARLQAPPPPNDPRRPAPARLRLLPESAS